jgi:hypothetical protein
LRQQTRAASKGLNLSNEATWVWNEYESRKRFAKLGFTEDISQLDSFRADCFMEIECELDRIRSETTEKSQRKRK